MALERRCWRERAALLAVMAVGACATSEGDALMRQRSFADAAAAYDRDLAAAPGDPDLQRKRDAARAEMVRARLEQGRAMRVGGHGEASLTILVDALSLETRFTANLPPDVARLRDEEIAAAGEVVAAVMQPSLAARAPLAARGRVARVLALLKTSPRLLAVRDKAEADIIAAGKASCTTLAASETARGPYFARLLASYCGPFGVTVTLPDAPEQRRGLRVSGKISNTTDPQHRTVESWVAAAFQQSPWYGAAAVAMMPVALSGQYDASLVSKRVTFTAPYTVRHRSTVDRGPMMRPYAIETTSQHAFAYEVEQFDARYHLDATFDLQLGAPSAALLIRVDWTEKRKAYQHDVTFPPAGIRPRRANLPTVNSWLSARLARKRLAFVRKLEARWSDAFCAGKQFGPEEGARCAYGGGKRPPAALAAVAAVFGPDAGPALDDLLRKRTAPEPPTEADADTDDDKDQDKTKKDAAPDAPVIEEVSPNTTESI
jgi:hypothetical protein